MLKKHGTVSVNFFNFVGEGNPSIMELKRRIEAGDVESIEWNHVGPNQGIVLNSK